MLLNKNQFLRNFVNVGMHSTFLAISVCSVAGYLACSTEIKESPIHQLALNLLKALGAGLTTYAASYLGTHGSIWSYRQWVIRDLTFASSIEWSINYLSERELGSHGNFSALLTGEGKYAIRIARALENLDRAGILTEKNRQALLMKEGEFSENISAAIINLHRAGLLTPDNRAALLESKGEFAGDFSLAIINSQGSGLAPKELTSLFEKPFSLPRRCP